MRHIRQTDKVAAAVVIPERTEHETQYELFNPLALELDIYSLAHHLCKM